MKLTLGISTSSAKFEVILSHSGVSLFNSQANPILAQNRNLSELLKLGLDKIGLVPTDIKDIILDIGPGGTSAVRTGVAFANGLSYSLGIPVYPIMSLELMGIEVWEKRNVPVLCLIKSVKDNVYIGLYNGNNIIAKYGKLDVVTKLLSSDIAEFSLAGVYQQQIISMYPEKTIHESSTVFASLDFFIENQKSHFESKLIFPNFAIPITEQVLDCYE